MLFPMFESTNSAKVHVDPGCAVFPKRVCLKIVYPKPNG